MTNSSIRKLSIALGLKYNTLSMMKHTNPDKFEYIFALDDDPIKSYKKYYDLHRELINELTEIYYFLSERRKIHYLAKRLVELGLRKSPKGMQHHMENALFRIEPKFYSHKSFLKYKAMLPIARDVVNEIKGSEG